MERITVEQASIDALTEQVGGYFSIPSKESMEYTEPLFDICRQFGIRYYSASSKERGFVDEVTRVTWARLNATPFSNFFIENGAVYF